MLAQSDPLTGRVIDGRYEIVSRIARGGMATVYLGRDRRLDREVAVKIMHAHLAEGTSGADFVARFRREARSAARLDHPGLVAVLDQGVDEELSYLVMEYVDGTDLRRRLRAEGSLTVQDSLDTAESVLEALASAHQAGYVHRDIKPENVLLGRRGKVKVADFGLARAVTEVTAATTGSLLGTVAYLAPELVARGTSDTRTDVYAVGILLYEMLTGRQPYSGDNAIHIAYQHVHARVPAPSDLVDWLPAELDDLVCALTAREIEERPENADRALELVRTARAALDAETLARRAEVTPPAAAGVEHPSSPDGATPGPESPAEVDPDATQALGVATPLDADPAQPDGPDALGRTISLKIGSGLLDPRARRRRVLGLVALVVRLVGGIASGLVGYMRSGPGAYTRVPQGLIGVTL
ncbi:protein kinase, partial [Actinotalea sp.]|uniref:protein kinase domain-containing protein n=1 Tax=Actinotalea sp. TaxID=1872145 RepID=UPI0035663D79